MTNHPLTCSEVVERLAAIAEECYHGPRDHGCSHGKQIAQDIREHAPEILHSWRERRVQELGEALQNFVKLVGDAVLVRNIEDDGDMVKYLRQGTRILEVLKQADAVLANSEWREQIRKGANHE